MKIFNSKTGSWIGENRIEEVGLMHKIHAK